MRNIRKDTVLERTFRAGEPLEDVFVENKDVQLLYKEGEDFVFMDTTSFEQYHVLAEIVGESSKYLKNEMICSLDLFEEEIIGVEPPMFVELEVTETDPGLRGDTVSGGSKPATVETGAVVIVPLFVTTGNRIKIDTRDDRYIERV
jgi:elongation factor P